MRSRGQKEIDEWTHYLHGPDNNAVADDTRVGPPRYMQWVVRARAGGAATITCPASAPWCPPPAGSSPSSTKGRSPR